MRMVFAELAAVALGTLVLLARYEGRPPWDSLILEDYRIYLPQALLHPVGSILQPYNGYLQLVPRLIAEAVAPLPFHDAALGFALAGALIASGCGLVVFHASAGHVRILALRVLLGASVLLLPTGLVIADTGLDTIWYLLFAAFWALLWRPRSRAGLLVAALVCFLAAASNALAAVFLPLAVARVIALPRLREQAATAGWVAGSVLQLPAVLTLSRHTQATSLPRALAFYGHYVILSAVAGQHLAARLWAAAGLGGAIAVAVFVLTVVTALTWTLGGPRVRVFAVAAFGLGLALTLTAVFVHGRVANVPALSGIPDLPDQRYFEIPRYGQVPILIIDSFLIVAADAFLRRGGVQFRHTAHAVFAVLLVAMLATSWVVNFRYATSRSTANPWPPTGARVERSCQREPSRHIRVLTVRMPCSKIVG